jgi:serine/threonine protein kinase/Flp pilus assembly protein TadD
MTSAMPSEKSIFLEAVELASAEERSIYLDKVCGGNASLRAQVDALVRAHEAPIALLDVPESAERAIESRPICEAPGTTIGLYKLLEQIGEGGMGIVYMAEQTHPVRRQVALKIIKPGMDTKQVIARFEVERQALALMDHPGIARVLDAGTTDSGRPYFVMELVRGVPITDYCDGEKLSIRERLELFVQVCQAVQHAHHKGIIHRDIKPTNVLITLHGGDAVPKMIDFGVAKAIGQQLTERTLFTGLAQFVGTPLYMSPEQAGLSGQDLDTRSDIYSLGVLLYELLSGVTPFDAGRLRAAALGEIQRIIREEEPPMPSARLSSLGDSVTAVSANRLSDPRKLVHSVRGELDWIVMKCLEKDRGRRYETANDFAADLKRYLTDQPVEACPPSAWYRFGKFARRNRASLGTAGLIMAALLAGTSISLWQAHEAEHARGSADRLLASEKQARNEAEIQRRRAQLNFDDAINSMSGIHLKLYSEFSRGLPPEIRQALADEIIRFFRRIVDQKDENKISRLERAQSYLHLGEAYGRTGNAAQLVAAQEQAMAILEGLTAEFPGETIHWQELGQAHFTLADHLMDAGQTIRAAREWREAAAAYRRAINIDPSDPRGQRMFGFYLSNCPDGAAFARAGRMEEAEAAYREALADFESLPAEIQDGPLRSAMRHYLAWLLATFPVSGLRNPARAVELARKAVELAPKAGRQAYDAWNTLGVALCRTGDWEAAIDALEMSQSMRPEQELALNGFFLAMAYWRVDRRAQARSWYDRAVESMDKIRPTDNRLKGFRAEAASMLGLNGLPADVFARPEVDP